MAGFPSGLFPLFHLSIETVVLERTLDGGRLDPLRSRRPAGGGKVVERTQAVAPERLDRRQADLDAGRCGV
jgi:hypothetical protein